MLLSQLVLLNFEDVKRRGNVGLVLLAGGLPKLRSDIRFYDFLQEKSFGLTWVFVRDIRTVVVVVVVVFSP